MLIAGGTVTARSTGSPYSDFRGAGIGGGVSGNGATDSGGNGNAAAKQFSLIYDKTRPKITAITPANGAEDVPVSGSFIISFSEAMNKENAPMIELSSSDILFPTRLNGTWSNGYKTYTVPYNTLSYKQSYSLTIPSDVFKDIAGNSAVESKRSFTTEAEPLISTASPKNLTIGLGGTASFSVALGQGSARATQATITASDGNKLSVTPALLTSTDNVTVNTKAPSWPSGSKLTVSHVAQSAATLTWTAASDPKTVVGYKIYQDGVLIGSTNGTDLSYTVIGLVPSTTYSFQVQAGNTYDVWSTDGPAISATTSSPAPEGNIAGDRYHPRSSVLLAAILFIIMTANAIIGSEIRHESSENNRAKEQGQRQKTDLCLHRRTVS